MKTIEQIVPLEYHQLFCKEFHCDDFELWKGDIICTVTECTENYYGHMLLQTIIVGNFTTKVVENWVKEVFLDLMGWSEDDLNAHEEYDFCEIIRQTELDELHDMWLQEELDWYNWARQNGYE